MLDWIDSSMRDGDLFFDVGANIGVYSIYAALRHSRLQVVAFEPEYANLHLFRDNILHNNLQERILVYSIALSNRTGTSFLHIQDPTPGASLHTESSQLLTMTRTQQRVIWREGISSYTLDEVCAQSGLTPNCMKIDVDGTEPEILEGAKRTLRSESLRSLIIEVPSQENRETCKRLLLSADFRCQWRDPLGRSPNEIWSREGSSLETER